MHHDPRSTVCINKRGPRSGPPGFNAHCPVHLNPRTVTLSNTQRQDMRRVAYLVLADDRGGTVANSKVCLEPMNSLLGTEVQASVYIPLIGGLVINRWLGAIRYELRESV